MFAPFRRLTPLQRRTFFACFFGWTLDAFDFFILTWCLDSVAQTFHVSNVTVTDSLFWTLCMRPVGALLFGALAERFGRKRILMVNIACFTIFGLSSAFAPTFGVFLVTRALFGVGMGGEWGVGAALAFETLPTEGRGFFSGLLQEGYSTGNLLAGALYGIAYALIFPHLHNPAFTNWRALFVLGTIPSLFVLWMLSGCAESPAWLATRQAKAAERIALQGAPAATHSAVRTAPSLLSQIAQYLPNFLLLVCMMTAFKTTATWVNSFGGIGSILGGICFGTLSEKLGRRRAIVTAALLAIPMIPMWAGLHGFAHTAIMLGLGGFLMQFMVQGAWGIIPVHLNELSPGPVRAIFPGLAYQIGNLTTSYNGHIQTTLAASFYTGHLAPILGWTVLMVAIAVALLAGFGKEAKGIDLTTTT
jgi:SHS family lactate transporter-like MFS transporter